MGSFRYERKVAATFFADPPKGTFEEALEHLYNAERLAKKDWKENKLLIAKCQVAMGKFKEGVDSLVKADAMEKDFVSYGCKFYFEAITMSVLEFDCRQRSQEFVGKIQHLQVKLMRGDFRVLFEFVLLDVSNFYR